MYFNLENLEISNLKKENRHITFEYEGKKYHYKVCKNITNYYNEMIAKKIADKLDINCCQYYLAIYDDSIGNVSEDFDTTNFHSMTELLKEFYHTDDNKNNLESIKYLLFKKYEKTVAEKLYNQLENIFLFDCIIGNCDRNSDNYGLIITGDLISFFIYDNENMLSDYAIYDGEYSLGITENDTDNYLYKYLDNNPQNQEKMKKMLNIISEESLEKIFEELEDKYEINKDIKRKLLELFSVNRNMILSYFSKKEKRR